MRRTRPTIITVAFASDERNIGSGKQTTDKRRECFLAGCLVRRRLSGRDVRGRRTADELCTERGHARRCCAWAWVGAVETIRFHLLVCRRGNDNGLLIPGAFSLMFVHSRSTRFLPPQFFLGLFNSIIISSSIFQIVLNSSSLPLVYFGT